MDRSLSHHRAQRAGGERRRCLSTRSCLLIEERYGDLAGAAVLILGAAYRGGVKETAFSGVFPRRRPFRSAARSPMLADPMYTVDELEPLGLPAHRGEPVTAAIIQADHAEYRNLGGDASLG